MRMVLLGMLAGLIVPHLGKRLDGWIHGALLGLVWRRIERKYGGKDKPMQTAELAEHKRTWMMSKWQLFKMLLGGQ